MVQKRRESQGNCGVVNSGVRATQGEVPHRHGIVKRGKCKVVSCGVSLGYRMVKK